MTPSIAISESAPKVGAREPAAWNAVFAMALCVAVLIASEFMPVSLLSPIARDLGLTDGQAGQAISISGVFAVITSLSIATLSGTMDRRFTLIGMSELLVVSGIVVALAPSFIVLMVGRALLGIAIGGFWSMSAATVMRLVPESRFRAHWRSSTAVTRSPRRSRHLSAASSAAL